MRAYRRHLRVLPDSVGPLPPLEPLELARVTLDLVALEVEAALLAAQRAEDDLSAAALAAAVATDAAVAAQLRVARAFDLLAEGALRVDALRYQRSAEPERARLLGLAPDTWPDEPSPARG